MANEPQQHDLLPDAARVVVAGAHLREGEAVLEIGAGRGALTIELLKAGAVVHAIERDAERCRILGERFARDLAAGTLILHAGDALRVGPHLTGRWRAIANPPFNLTADLVRRWMLDPPGDQPEAMDLVLQYEAARKLCGRDTYHNRSSVLTRLVGKPWISAHLRRDQVTPPSRVDLCVWSLRRVASAPPPEELQRIDRLLAIAFAGAHTVADALRGLATGLQIRRQAAEHGWKPDGHPRELKPSSWRSLATLLAMCGKI